MRKHSNVIGIMGISTVTLEVLDLALSGKPQSVDFMVDSGAFLTVVPQQVWKDLKIKAEARQKFSLADGRIISRPVGFAMLRLGRNRAPCKVVLGEKDDQPLLGATSLENLGLVLDPLKRKLLEAQAML